MEKLQTRSWLKDLKRFPDTFAEASWRAIYEDLSIKEFGGVIIKLKELIKKFESQPSRIQSDMATGEALETIEKSFTTFVPWYYKNIPKTVNQPPSTNPEHWLDYLKLGLYEMSKDTQPDRYYEKGQIEFLKLLVRILETHGVSPSISSRDNRFIVSYFFKFMKSAKTEYSHFASLTDLEQNVCQPFQHQKVMLINGSLVQSKDLLKVRIFETKLNQDEVIFELEKGQKRKLKPTEFTKICQDPSYDLFNPFEHHFKEVTSKLLQAPKSPFSLDRISTQYQIARFAERFPLIYKRTETAIQNFEKTGNTRNFIDELRLSLELMLHELLGNAKSLENQDKPLKDYFNAIEGSGFVRALFQSTRKTYEDIQNNHVKHGDSLNDRDFRFVLNLHFNLLGYLVP